ncbi:hypothetical protein JVU11DRAFT_11725 [Chiua virens]|nr:hypothetical protein JVU11DRAFT_11725 [Chiua virens]
MCRKHCRAAGGCTCEGHSISPGGTTMPPITGPSSGSQTVQPATNSSSSLQTLGRSPSPSLSQIDPVLLSEPHPSVDTHHLAPPQSLPPKQSPPAPQTAHTPDPSSINPRFASHLQPLLAEHAATVHQRAAEKRQKEAQQAQQYKQATHYVMAFSFTQDDTKPTSVNFQEFSYPLFVLTRQVLVELELAQPDQVLPCSINYFNPREKYWVRMKVNTQIIVTMPGQRLFFKGVHVQSFPDFDVLYRTASSALGLSSGQSNFRTMATANQSHEVIDLSSVSDTEDDSSTIVGDLTPQPPLKSVNSQAVVSSSHVGSTICPSTRKLWQGNGLSSYEGASTSQDIDALPLLPDDTRSEDRLEDRCACLIPGISPATARFPSSFYVIDIQRSFNFERQGSLTMEMQFERFFGLAFRSTTYYDHKVRWDSVPSDARQRVLAAAYTEEGRYATFIAAYPAKDADLKVAKRKIRAAAAKQLKQPK